MKKRLLFSSTAIGQILMATSLTSCIFPTEAIINVKARVTSNGKPASGESVKFKLDEVPGGPSVVGKQLAFDQTELTAKLNGNGEVNLGTFQATYLEGDDVQPKVRITATMSGQSTDCGVEVADVKETVIEQPYAFSKKGFRVFLDLRCELEDSLKKQLNIPKIITDSIEKRYPIPFPLPSILPSPNPSWMPRIVRERSGREGQYTNGLKCFYALYTISRPEVPSFSIGDDLGERIALVPAPQAPLRGFYVFRESGACYMPFLQAGKFNKSMSESSYQFEVPLDQSKTLQGIYVRDAKGSNHRVFVYTGGLPVNGKLPKLECHASTDSRSDLQMANEIVTRLNHYIRSKSRTKDTDKNIYGACQAYGEESKSAKFALKSLEAALSSVSGTKTGSAIEKSGAVPAH